jgi:chromatin remodeling complex protein RSC6
MVRASKQSTTLTVKEPEQLLEMENTSLPASVVVAKKEKKVSAKAKAKVEVESVVKVESVEVLPTSESSVVEVLPPVASLELLESSIEFKLSEFSSKLQMLTATISAVRGQFKVIEKVIVRELKAAKKSSSRKSKRAGNRQPSGFIRPTLISDELASFLNKPAGTEMARTAVSKEINLYIRTNSLQDKTNGRKIIPDESLAKLLRLSVEDDLTYFNLQRYMKPHFVKVVAPVVEASVEVVSE